MKIITILLLVLTMLSCTSESKKAYERKKDNIISELTTENETLQRTLNEAVTALEICRGKSTGKNKYQVDDAVIFNGLEYHIYRIYEPSDNREYEGYYYLIVRTTQDDYKRHHVPEIELTKK